MTKILKFISSIIIFLPIFLVAMDIVDGKLFFIFFNFVLYLLLFYTIFIMF